MTKGGRKEGVWRIEELEVIGFTDVLGAPSVPQRLVPIFRPRDDQSVVFAPPYTLTADCLVDPMVIPHREFSADAARGHATLLEKGFSAVPSGTLWVDSHGEVHYAPERKANEVLAAFAEQQYRQGLACLEVGDYEGALARGRAAFAANDSSVFALALQAASLHKLGEDDIVIRKLATTLPDGMAFEEAFSFLLLRASKAIRASTVLKVGAKTQLVGADRSGRNIRSGEPPDELKRVRVKGGSASRHLYNELAPAALRIAGLNRSSGSHYPAADVCFDLSQSNIYVAALTSSAVTERINHVYGTSLTQK